MAPELTTRVVQFNDVEALERELDRGDVACVLTEPALTNIGIVLPEDGFHDALRSATARAGVLLIVDETHTISEGPGGWTGAHGLQPDMLVVGKPIGSGVAAAALGLSRAVSLRLEARLDRSHAGMAGVGGTLAANALAMAVTRVTLDHVLTEDAYRRTTALGGQLREGLEAAIGRHHLPWHVVQIGGRVEYHFSPRRRRGGGDRQQGVVELPPPLRPQPGVMVFPFHNRALVSPAHTPGDVALHSAVIEEAIASLLEADSDHTAQGA